MNPIAGGSDSSGYMNFARLLDEGKVEEALRLPKETEFASFREALFAPLGFRYQESSQKLSPTYPAGMPLALSIGGLHRSTFALKCFWASTALLTFLGIWKIGGLVELRESWRFYVVVTVLASPMLLWSSISLMTDALAACQAVWCVYLALKSKEAKWAAIALGTLLGWAVLTRPTNALLFATALGLFALNRIPISKLLLMCLGGAPVFIFWVWMNNSLYGSPFAFGYSPLSRLLKWEHFLPTVWYYAKTLGFLLPFLALLTAVLSLFSVRNRHLWMIVLWGAPIFLFYAFYYYTSQTWWYSRFVLPGMPAIAFASAFWFQERCHKLRSGIRGEGGLVLLLGVIAIVYGYYWQDELRVLGQTEIEDRYRDECAWANANLPAESLIVCMQASGAIYYYTDFPILRWDWPREEEWEQLMEIAARKEIPVYAFLHYSEQDKENSPLLRFPDRWEFVEDVAWRAKAFRLVEGAR